jgi:hypothetical protein
MAPKFVNDWDLTAARDKLTDVRAITSVCVDVFSRQALDAVASGEASDYLKRSDTYFASRSAR